MNAVKMTERFATVDPTVKSSQQRSGLPALASTMPAHVTNSLNLALAQVDRYQNTLKEKDTTIHALKEEIILLKAVELKQNKDIRHLESDVSDAPRTIANLREEVDRLKKKIKSYYAQINLDSKHIRQITSDKQILREEQARLQTLVTEKGLDERHSLKAQVDTLNADCEAERAKNKEIQDKFQMIERNLGLDNKHLRSRVAQAEKELSDLRTVKELLEEDVKEKEKEISSLTIYRYNAIHRKTEVGCKACKRREKEEAEKARRSEIFEKLPMISDFTLSVLNASTVQVSVLLPERSESIQFSKLTVFVSEKPGMPKEHRKTLVITSFPDSLKKGKTGVSGKRANDTIKYSPLHYDVEGLTSGTTYYMQATLSHDDVDGKGSEIKSIVPDVLPSQPLKPIVETKSEPLACITLRFPEIPSNGCSKIQTLRVYHSNQPFDSDASRLGYKLLTEVKYEGETFPITYQYFTPSLSVNHYFVYSAVNACGESAWSFTSDVAHLDITPPKPSIPIIKRLSSSSIQIESSVKPHAGSPIHAYKIHYSEISEGGQQPDPVTVDVVATGIEKCKLAHVLQGLNGKSTYRFQVQAVNKCGVSIMSEYSNAVSIDSLLTVPPSMSPIEVISESDATVDLTNILDHMHPLTTGIRIIASGMPDMRNPITLHNQFDLTRENSVTLKFPVPVECYFVSCCYLGPNGGESIYSSPAFVALAAAVPLPVSTPGSPTAIHTPAYSTYSSSQSINIAKHDLKSKSNLDIRGSSDRLNAGKRGVVQTFKKGAVSNARALGFRDKRDAGHDSMTPLSEPQSISKAKSQRPSMELLATKQSAPTMSSFASGSQRATKGSPSKKSEGTRPNATSQSKPRE